MIIRLEQLKKWLRGESKEERVERVPASPETSPQDVQAAHQAHTDPFDAFAAVVDAYQSQQLSAVVAQQQANAYQSALARQAMYQQAMQYPTFESDAAELARTSESLAEFNHFFCMRTASDDLVDMMKWMRDNCANYFAIIPVRRHAGYLACFVAEHDAVAFRMCFDNMSMIER